MDGGHKVSPRPGAPTVEPVARGVWLMRGGLPKRTLNVYLLEDDGGVTLFDAGASGMAPFLADVGARMGGIRRVVLGHAHPDHRGSAPGLGAPVYCHPDEVSDVEGDGGRHYLDASALHSPIMRRLLPYMLELWDGGPVSVEGTVAEGDEVAGFEVRHLPGHAPGLIGLWRQPDRLALVSDAVFTMDLDSVLMPFDGPQMPPPGQASDREQARDSIRKLAALEPAAVWAGHANPVTGDVRRQLEQAAEAT